MHGHHASLLSITLIAATAAVCLGLSACGSPPKERESRTLLLTGFGPFGSHATNPAWETAKALDGMVVGRTRVVGAQLDVVYAKAGEQLRAAVEAHSPHIIVCMGVAPGDRIRLETVAKNRDTCPVADNEGVIRADDPIREGGAARIPSGLPVDVLLEKLQEGGYEVRTSDDAGGYLCNHVFYRLMDEHARARTAGFVHVPAMGSVWTLDRLQKAILAIVEVLDDQP